MCVFGAREGSRGTSASLSLPRAVTSCCRLPRRLSPTLGRSQAQHRYQLQERNVKEYLQEHKAPADLRGRILQYYEYRFPDRRFYEIEHLVAQLPRSIQEVLAVHLHSPEP